MADDGASPAEIQVRYRVSQGAVRGSITQDSARPEGMSAPRPGCPPIYTERDERMILRNLRLYPKSTFDERRKECGLISATLLSNDLHKSMAFTIGAQRNDQNSQRNMLLLGFFGASVGLIGVWKNGKSICGVTSVLQSGGGAN